MKTQKSKKAVIANWGHAKQGKSATVKLIAQILLQKQGASSVPVLIDYTIDINVVITIGKLKIGVESVGDPGSRLFTSLDEFVKQGCDLIVCSTRTSGRTVQAVEELYSKDGYDNIWVTNHRSNEQDQSALNQLSAAQIVSMMELFTVLP